MKNSAKMLLRFFGCFILCFVVIYLSVFFGAWKMFESGDPIRIEIGVSFIFSIFFFAINEVITAHDKKIKELENKIKLLEDKTLNK